MQAAINSNPKTVTHRKLHIGLHFEIGMVPVNETPKELADGNSSLERAYHRQQLAQRVSADHDAAYRRLKLGY